ncbi:MAG: FG-GAP-like repeat-containing protein [Patescibacteria group bacterium]|jgi:sugar lactone lactonase YvrE
MAMGVYFTQSQRIIPIIAITFMAFFVFGGTAHAYGEAETYVGKIYSGDGQAATSALLDFSEDVLSDGSGNFYIADTYNNVIRKVGTNGKISTYAGTGAFGERNGAADSAEFGLPRGIARDSSGNIYVADTGNNAIRKITPSGSVSTLLSNLSGPEGLAVYNTTLYIAETGSGKILFVSTNGGSVTTLTTGLSEPKKLVVTDVTIYVADAGLYKVMKVDRRSGIKSTLSGSGTKGYKEGAASTARFQNLWGIAKVGSTLYVSDGNGLTDYIRKVNTSTGATELFVSDARMRVVNYPAGIAAYNNKLYVAMAGLSTVVQFATSDGDDVRFAGNDRFGFTSGTGTGALLGRPHDMVISPDRTYIYLAENNKIRRMTRATGSVDGSWIVGSSIDDYIGEGFSGEDARFSNISGITIDSAGENLYVVDHWNNRIRKVNIASKMTSLVAGGGDFNTGGPGNGYAEGTGSAARFDNPTDIAISPDDAWLYITDTSNNRIRKIRISTGVTTLVAGGSKGNADATGSNAKFNAPWGITIDRNGNYLYVADRNNHTIRRIEIATQDVVTIAGRGSAGYLEGVRDNAVFSFPLYVEFDDNILYITDNGSHRIRLYDLTANVSKLISGEGVRGFENGAPSTAEFNNLSGLAVDHTGRTLYVADQWSDLIRRVDITGPAPFAEDAPEVSGIGPNTIKKASHTASEAYLDMSGTGFRHGMQAQFGPYPATVYIKSDTSATIVIPIAQMPTGWYDVKVTNVDGQTDIFPVSFTLQEADGSIPTRTFTLDVVDGFLSYPTFFQGGVNVAVGDVDGDGIDDLITVPKGSGGPQVRVFSKEGSVKGQFFAYDSTYRGGTTIAAGDIDGDGIAEIITGTEVGNYPLIRIFDSRGNLQREFYAFASNIRVGASVAAGDVDGDGKDEIVVTPRERGGPQVRVFDGNGNVLGQFFAYPAWYRLGLSVAVGHIDDTNRDKIIIVPLNVGGPHVRIFDGRGTLEGQFFAYPKEFRIGLSVAAGDVDADGFDEIIVVPAAVGGPHVRSLDAFGNVDAQFFAYGKTTRYGTSVASGDVNGDGVDDIVTGPLSGIANVIPFSASGIVIQ